MFCLTPNGLGLLMLTPDGHWPITAIDWLAVLITTPHLLPGAAGPVGGRYRLRPAPGQRRRALLATGGGALLLAADGRADAAGAALLAAALALHWLRAGRAAPA